MSTETLERASRETGQVALEICKRIGPSITKQQFTETFAKTGRTLSHTAFYDIYRRAFGTKYVAPDRTPDEEETEEAEPEVATVEIRRDDADRYSAFARFALSVQAVGGIEAARKLLDLMETVRQIVP